MPRMDESFFRVTGLPWLLVDRSGSLLDGNPPLLSMMGWQQLPVGERISDHFSVDLKEACQSEGTWRQLDGHYTTATGDQCRMACCSFCQGDRLFLLIERTHSLLSTDAMSAMSKLNDELVDVTRELQKKKAELEDVLARVRTLEGILPICASCKKIRVEDNRWEPVETYITRRTTAHFSHGICPICAKQLYPDYVDEQGKNDKEL